MIILYLAILIVLCCTYLFTFTYKVDGLNRAVINAPTEIFECSVPIMEIEKEDPLYYLKENVEQKYKEYLDSIIYHYVSSYDVNYYFYNLNDKGLCDFFDCNGVEVTVIGNVSSFYQYKRKMFYEIRRTENG